MSNSVLLVDIDGTLTEPKIWPAPQTDAEWLAMYANATPSNPIIQFVLEIAPMFDSVRILTGRKINASQVTLGWLSTHVPTKFDSLIMRAMENNDPPFLFKTEIVKEMLDGKYDKAVLIDDDPLVRHFAREAGAYVIDPEGLRDSFRRD